MSYDLSDYVDVAERIRVFSEKYPDGCLQSELDFQVIAGMVTGVTCRAYAFRSADDERPGIGHAYEPIPGTTPFTRDSEVMNAETSAWGRAIVALGFATKKIASREEVQNRSGAAASSGREIPSGEAPQETAAGSTTDAAPDNPAARAQAAQEAARASRTPDDNGIPSRVAVHFGKNKGKRLGELTARQLSWYADKWQPGTVPEDRRLKMAAQALVAGDDNGDFDIPF